MMNILDIIAPFFIYQAATRPSLHEAMYNYRLASEAGHAGHNEDEKEEKKPEPPVVKWEHNWN